MSRNHVVLYEWLCGPSYLVRKLVPAAFSIQAGVDDTADEIVAKIPAGTDTFFFHLNCTVTTRFPRGRNQLIDALQKREIQPVNERVTDVSKRAVQRHCRTAGLGVTLADRTGDPEEKIIVKSNLNFAGASERFLSDAERAFLGVGAGSGLIWNPYHYLVKTRKEIKDKWWDDENLVLERFIANSDGGWYRAYVMGKRMVLCLLSNELEVKKVSESRLEMTWFVDLASESDLESTDAPDTIVRSLTVFKKAFDLDFGTIDIVFDNSHQPFIVDVNPTPAYNHPLEGVVEYLTMSFK